ncbi:alpha/beta fold hydrolase [Thermoflexus sp.]|jgi:pimeloyl-ACP methyl ester carboxylesterase|uniref:alpha/beta fold hydrolase n=1 Tax=Thermoflexus sp. TaxID=1969742 RepID=UPI003C01749E
MSSIVTEQGIVHYEVIGRGRPVIFLHGWLGSWAYWIDTMNALSRHCRSYALDFWGFGESDRQRASFTVPSFIDLVTQFMDRLGIASAALVGHSMGGTVALGVALAHPERVTRVAVVGSPITGSSLNFFLKMAGRPFWAFLAYTFPVAVKAGTYLASPTITRAWRTWYRMWERDLSRTSLRSFFQSIGSLHRTDLRPRLRELRTPVLGIYGARDNIVNPDQAFVLAREAPQASIFWMPKAGHFPMLDEPERFRQALADFLLA